jgi:hypothetical protein
MSLEKPAPKRFRHFELDRMLEQFRNFAAMGDPQNVEGTQFEGARMAIQGK